MTQAVDLGAGLPDAADLPVSARPEIPLWIENFWWLAFDEQHRMGVMVHPCVINTRSATRQIRTGDVIRIDGKSGIVEILERAVPAVPGDR